MKSSLRFKSPHDSPVDEISQIVAGILTRMPPQENGPKSLNSVEERKKGQDGLVAHTDCMIADAF